MRFTGEAIVLVGCTDPEQVRASGDKDCLGENAWGPFPLAEAHEIARQIEMLWAAVLAEHGSAAFPYGLPHAEVHPCVGARNRSTDRVDIVTQAADNWTRLIDLDETLGEFIARHPVLGA